VIFPSWSMAQGVCIAADNPLDAQGNSIETLIVGNI
jgi:hypothetical protein